MDKPFCTYDQLASIMKSRGLDPGDHYKVILEREGYYPVVNGYKDPFLSERDKYIAGSTLDEIYALFVMDRRLRALLFRYITLAEGVLKSVSCYEFCLKNKDDNEAYLDPANYRSDKKYRGMILRFIKDLNRMLGRDDCHKSSFTKDYLNHYIISHDNVPLWVIMNSLTLGQAFKFYTFQNESIRFAISQRFQRMHIECRGADARRITHESLRLAYDHIKDYRNICAHDERLYCARVDKSKSTNIKRLLNDLSLVLTVEQCKTLSNGINECLNFASCRIDTIDISLILKEMGFNSLEEISECLAVRN